MSVIPWQRKASVLGERIPLTGVEYSPHSPQKTRVADERGAQSGSLTDDPPSPDADWMKELVAGLTADERRRLAALLRAEDSRPS
jgi:hypothetical protein